MDGTWMELDCLAQKDYQQLFGLPCVGESNFFATSAEKIGHCRE
jgi:hypothetical protein